MEMYQIRYFLAVCDTLNFTRASERCYVSQPSLTKAIQKLEDTLGGRLFDRTKNSVRLTELGRVMQPHMTQLYHSARAAKEQARIFLHDQHEKLNIGIMCTICLDPLTEMLSRFQKENPQIELHFDSRKLEEMTDMLDRGDLDLAIAASPYDFPPRFESTALFEEGLVVSCGANHPFAQKKTISLKDLDGQSYVSRENCEYADFISAMLDDLGVELKVRHATEREDWVQTMIRAGFGIAFMPENSCKTAGLCSVRIDAPELKRHIRILTAAGRTKSAGTKAFIAMAQASPWQGSAPDSGSLAA
jgi:LysR family transcriptional regulator, hydrogen peroxide-inducible genes activator